METRNSQKDAISEESEVFPFKFATLSVTCQKIWSCDHIDDVIMTPDVIFQFLNF